MCVLIKLIGIYLIAIGVVVLFTPKAYNKILKFFRKEKRVYIAGILRIFLGILFLSAAQQSRLKIFLVVIGILTVIGGILIFVPKQKKLQEMIDWFDKIPSIFIRLWGIVAIILGALLIYSV